MVSAPGGGDRRPLGVAVAGFGWMGRVHTQAYARVLHHFPQLPVHPVLVAVADDAPDRAAEAAGRFGFATATRDWRDLAADPRVEAVSITAPNFMHREMALAAAAAGKHFWGEKPLGRFPAETAEIAAAADRAGIRTIVGLNYRHPPAVQHARRLIAEGALGEITHFRMQFVASYSSNPKGALSWRFTRELAGLGILADLGSHAVDLAQCLLGPIARVSASTSILIVFFRLRLLSRWIARARGAGGPTTAARYVRDRLPSSGKRAPTPLRTRAR